MTAKIAQSLTAVAIATTILLASGHLAFAQVAQPQVPDIGDQVVHLVIDGSSDRVKPQFETLPGSPVLRDKKIWMYYNPAGQPENISTEVAVEALKASMARWSEMCNIDAQYVGLSNFAANNTMVNIFGWMPFAPLPSGREGPGAVMSSLGLGSNRSIVIDNSNIVLNPAYPWTPQMLNGYMSSTFGQVLGLANSKVADSVMSGRHSIASSYQLTLRGDDAAGCAALYGASPDAPTNRTLNWVEQVFAPALLQKDLATQTQHYDGYTYRAYQGGLYAGSKNGSAYFMGPDGIPLNLGPLSMYWDSVTAAGF